MPESIRVLICDDHELFREGLRRALEIEEGIEVIGEAQDGQEAVQKTEELFPDVVLMDIRMEVAASERSGLKATGLIKDHVPSTQVLMLTASEDQSDLFDAIKVGASGYLLKGSSGREVADAIRDVNSGVSLISPAMASKLISEFVNLSQQKTEGSGTSRAQLSTRETEVLRLIAKGYSNKKIAVELDVSENTAKKHVRNILDKIHMRSRVEAALYAVREGLIDNEDPPVSR